MKRLTAIEVDNRPFRRSLNFPHKVPFDDLQRMLLVGVKWSDFENTGMMHRGFRGTMYAYVGKSFGRKSIWIEYEGITLAMKFLPYLSDMDKVAWEGQGDLTRSPYYIPKKLAFTDAKARLPNTMKAVYKLGFVLTDGDVLVPDAET